MHWLDQVVTDWVTYLNTVWIRVESILLQLVTASWNYRRLLFVGNIAWQQVTHSNFGHLIWVFLLNDPLVLKRRAYRLVVFAERVNVVLYCLHLVGLQDLSLRRLVYCSVALLNVRNRRTIVLKTQLTVVNYSLGRLNRSKSPIKWVACLASSASDWHKSLFYIIGESVVTAWCHCVFVIGIVITVAFHDWVLITGADRLGLFDGAWHTRSIPSIWAGSYLIHLLLHVVAVGARVVMLSIICHCWCCRCFVFRLQKLQFFFIFFRYQ